jgi:hypothetical protein
MLTTEGEKGRKGPDVRQRFQALQHLRYLLAASRYALPLLSYTVENQTQTQEEGGCWKRMNYVIINVVFVALALYIRNAATSPIS